MFVQQQRNQCKQPAILPSTRLYLRAHRAANRKDSHKQAHSQGADDAAHSHAHVRHANSDPELDKAQHSYSVRTALDCRTVRRAAHRDTDAGSHRVAPGGHGRRADHIGHEHRPI